ncbi:MAG: hypothetical protein ABI614_00010 [Planctomycetota bacterium]
MRSPFDSSALAERSASDANVAAQAGKSLREEIAHTAAKPEVIDNEIQRLMETLSG